MDGKKPNALTLHMRSHGVVHLVWLVVILVGIIIGLSSVKLGTDSSVKDILNFAVALSSLLLALVAIVQAVVSSGSMSDTIGEVHRAVASISDPAEKLNQAANVIATHSQNVDDSSKKISAVLDKMHQDEVHHVRPFTEARKETFSAEMLIDASMLTLVSLYVVLNSYERKMPYRNFVPDLGDRARTDEVSNFVGGFVNALIDGFVVGSKSIDGAYAITDLGELSWLAQNRTGLLILQSKFGTQESLTSVISAIDEKVTSFS